MSSGSERDNFLRQSQGDQVTTDRKDRSCSGFRIEDVAMRAKEERE
jgi:hypothetical protein